MDLTQQKALNALEPYLVLSKSANSPLAAVDLITRATSAVNTFVFAELLETPNIQALRTASPEQASYVALLELFAWGTWSDYKLSQSSHIPPLSEPQARKLRQLSLLTLCDSPSTLTYPHLLTALELPTIRALEDLIISCLYAGLLTVKLDTVNNRLNVSSVAPLRDLRANSVPQMVQVLADWDARCIGVLGDIEAQMKAVRQRAVEARRRERENEKALEHAMGKGLGMRLGTGGAAARETSALKAPGKRGAGDKDEDYDDGGGGGGGPGEAADEMDVDEGGQWTGRPRGAKRGGGGGRLAGLAKKLGG